MSNNGMRKGSWAAGVAFVGFSGAVALGWLHEADLWVLRPAQEHHSGFLDGVLGLFPLIGGPEVSGVMLLALLTGLFVRDRRALMTPILLVLVTTGLLELAMKLFLPQVPIQKETVRAEDYAPLVAMELPYPYPSGHVLRSVIILGALCLLSRNWFLRASSLAVLIGIATSRVYFGVHWASDVVGGALLGAAGLLWGFSGKRV
jgi:undecaprenyl-diphosphatase